MTHLSRRPSAINAKAWRWCWRSSGSAGQVSGWRSWNMVSTVLPILPNRRVPVSGSNRKRPQTIPVSGSVQVLSRQSRFWRSKRADSSSAVWTARSSRSVNLANSPLLMFFAAIAHRAEPCSSCERCSGVALPRVAAAVSRWPVLMSPSANAWPSSGIAPAAAARSLTFWPWRSEVREALATSFCGHESARSFKAVTIASRWASTQLVNWWHSVKPLVSTVRSMSTPVAVLWVLSTRV